MKLLQKIVALSLVFSMLVTPVSVKASNEENPTMKIGLFYGSSAVATTNLRNYDALGYYYGYYDESGDHFTSVYDTSIQDITIMKDKNIYLGSDGKYYDSLVSNSKGTIGAYHFELSQTFSNQSEAYAKASSIGNEAFVAYIDGSYKVRVGSFTSESHANENRGKYQILANDFSIYVVGFSEDTYTVTNTTTTKILFEYSNNTKFGVKPKSVETWNAGYRYNGGFEYYRQTGNDLNVINVVSMQDYVKGVIPYEMSASWHIEALKAQSLCARSYGFNNMDKHSRYGFDLCNTVDCQVYRGTSQANSNSNSAVDETLGEYIAYEGDIATGFFHSSDGGATENSENVWSSTVPYLRGVIDPYEQTHSVGNGIWEETITAAQIEWILEAKGYSLNGVADMYIKNYTEMGNVLTLTVVDDSGKHLDFNKEQARIILNSTTHSIDVKSQRYRINEVMPGTVSSEVSVTSGVYINDEEFETDYGFEVLGADGREYISDIEGLSVITADGINDIGVSSTITNVTAGEEIDVPADTYVINGRGWGHNVGMSQFGAKAMAEQGFSYEDIVTFYFTDTEVLNMG